MAAFFTELNSNIEKINRGNLYSATIPDSNGYACFVLPKANNYSIQSVTLNGYGVVYDYIVDVSRPDMGLILLMVGAGLINKSLTIHVIVS